MCQALLQDCQSQRRHESELSLSLSLSLVISRPLSRCAERPPPSPSILKRSSLSHVRSAHTAQRHQSMPRIHGSTQQLSRPRVTTCNIPCHSAPYPALPMLPAESSPVSRASLPFLSRLTLPSPFRAHMPRTHKAYTWHQGRQGCLRTPSPPSPVGQLAS